MVCKKIIIFFLFLISFQFVFSGDISFGINSQYNIYYDENNPDFTLYRFDVHQVDENEIPISFKYNSYPEFSVNNLFPFSFNLNQNLNNIVYSCDLNFDDRKIDTPFLSHPNVIQVKDIILGSDGLDENQKSLILQNNLWMEIQISYSLDGTTENENIKMYVDDDGISESEILQKIKIKNGNKWQILFLHKVLI